MSLLASLLLIAVGVGLSLLLVPRANGLERVGYGVVFSLAAVPLLAMHGALYAGDHVSPEMLVGISLVLGGSMFWEGSARMKAAWAATEWSRDDAVGVGVALLSGALIAAHHHHADFLIGVASYLGKGETECFYMQSFELFGLLNAGVSEVPVDTLYGIASTPGNTLFTSAMLPLVGAAAFRLLHGAFATILVLFVQAILRRWGVPALLAAAVGLWTVLNPWFLFVEVLDRNVIALALSSVLIHSLLVHKPAHLLHGILFGLTAGAGLRFLGLTWILPVVLLKAPERPGKGWIAFGLGFVAAFAFNVPHLQHHGFHSLGETEPLFTLAAQALSGSRTPFLPLAVGPYYVLHALGSLGVIAAAVAVTGLFERQRRRELLVLGLMAVLPFLLVSVQRDWVQVDKTRIGLAGSLWLPLATGLGSQALRQKQWKPALVALLVCAALPPMLGRMAGQVDVLSYARHPVYQRETPLWAEHSRRAFAKVHLWPGYDRLWHKLDWGRKRAEERVVAHRLFPGEVGGDTGLTEWLFGADRRELPTTAASADFVNLRIDLAALVGAPSSAVTLDGSQPLLDLSRPESILDIHFANARVPWQAEPLGVAILPGGPERGSLGELYVDLNAFAAFGADDLGFQRVDLVHNKLQIGGIERARAQGMTALPWGEERSTLDLRVPKDLKVILRWWLVDGWTGLPHRVEAWSIEGVEEGDPRAVWHPLEPESYL